MTNFSYFLPSKLVFANHSLEQINTYIQDRKTLLITSPTFINNGTVRRLKKLTNQIIEVVADTKSHPEFKDLNKIYNKVHQQDYELVLAVGGGSVLDAAKYFSVYAAETNTMKTAQFVEDLVKDLTNLNYRSKLLEATLFSGLAFSNTQTVLAHAMSYYITAHKGLPHGIACSFTLPNLIDEIIGKYDFIDKALIEIFGELNSNKLRNLLAELNIATEFKDYGLTAEEIKQLIASLNDTQRAGNSLVAIK